MATASATSFGNVASGQNAIWKSANSATPQSIATVSNPAWSPVEVGDFNARMADVLWRNGSGGANSIWLSGNVANSQAVAVVADPAWHVVP